MSALAEQRTATARALLGCAITSQRGAEALQQHTEPADFPIELRPVAQALLELFSSGGLAGVNDLHAHLQAAGHAGFTATALADLTVEACNAAHVRTNAERLRELNAGEELRGLAQSALAHLQAGNLAKGELDRIRQEILEATATGGGHGESPTKHFTEATRGALEELEANLAGAPIPEIPHGITPLRSIVSGLEPGRLYVIGGRTGHGKSLVIGEMLRHATSHVAPYLGRVPHGLLVSLEMTEAQVVRRAAAADLAIPGTWLRDARTKLTDAQRDQYRAFLQDAERHPQIHIAGSRGHTRADMSSLQRIVSVAQQRHREGLCDLLAVDHATLVQGAKGKELRERVIRVVETLKYLAQSLDIPVLLASQLNSKGHEQNDRPHRSNLAESSALSQTADVIILLYRPEYGIPRAPRKIPPEQDAAIEPYEFLVCKNRDGAEGVAPAAVDLATYRLGDRSETLSASRQRGGSVTASGLTPLNA